MKAPITLLLLSLFIASATAQRVPTSLVEVYDSWTVENSTTPVYQPPRNGTWAQGAPMIPGPRYYGGSVMYTRNDTMWLYVFGGDTTGGGVPTRTCSRYNVNTNTWELIAPLPTPMRVNAAARLGDKLYTMGGFAAPFPSPALAKLYEYDVNANSWRELPNLPSPMFFMRSVGVRDSLVYILGGIADTPRGDRWRNDVHVYYALRDLYSKADTLPLATANFGIAFVDLKFLITGGLASTTILLDDTQVGEINPVNELSINWTFRERYPLSLHAHYGYPVSTDETYFAGGSTTTGFAPIRDAYSFSFSSNSFTVEPDIPYNAMAFYGGVNLDFSKGSMSTVLKVVIAGGITTGPALTNQTWIFTDTLSTMDVQQTGIEIPTRFSLKQNYPNPFNPRTIISFDIPRPTRVTVGVYDALGQEVERLLQEHLGPGSFTLPWNADQLPSGVYFYRITAGEFSSTRKAVLRK